jgi:hypothetical protein
MYEVLVTIRVGDQYLNTHILTTDPIPVLIPEMADVEINSSQHPTSVLNLALGVSHVTVNRDPHVAVIARVYNISPLSGFISSALHQEKIKTPDCL